MFNILEERKDLCYSNHIQVLFSIMYQEFNNSEHKFVQIAMLLKTLKSFMPNVDSTGDNINDIIIEKEKTNAIDQSFWKEVLEGSERSEANLECMTFDQALNAFVAKLKQ